MRTGAGGGAQTVFSHEHHDAPDVGFVVGVDGALGAALVERTQDPAPVALDEEPDDGFPRRARDREPPTMLPSAAGSSGSTQT